MNSNANGSSVDPVDPEDVTIRDDRKSVSSRKSQRDSAVSSTSLSAMSDLDYDAEPSTPVTSHPQTAGSTNQNTGNSPLGNWQQQQPESAPSVDLIGQPQHDRDAPGPGGASALSQPQFKLDSSGLGYKPPVDEAVPDVTCPLPRDSSKEGLALSCSKPEHKPYDAVIICHPDDLTAVEDLQKLLNNLVLDDRKPARVAVENDDSAAGKGEFACFEEWLDKAEYVFLYTSKKFCTNRQCNFKKDVAMIDSLFVQFRKKEFVIPIFLEDKFKCKYISKSVRAIKGIDFTGCKWTEHIAKIFKDNLNAARKGRKERELLNDMSSMKLED